MRGIHDFGPRDLLVFSPCLLGGHAVKNLSVWSTALLSMLLAYSALMLRIVFEFDLRIACRIQCAAFCRHDVSCRCSPCSAVILSLLNAHAVSRRWCLLSMLAALCSPCVSSQESLQHSAVAVIISPINARSILIPYVSSQETS